MPPRPRIEHALGQLEPDSLEGGRPVCLLQRGDRERLQAVADALTELRASDSYDLSLISFLASHLGITPRAVLTRALVGLYEAEVGSKMRRRRVN